MTNPYTCTSQQFFLRTRVRNNEKRPAIVRTNPGHTDVERANHTINSQPRLAHEPFDAASYANHKHRDADKAKWLTKKGFRSKKAPAMPPKEY